MKHILEEDIYSYLLEKSSIFKVVMKEDFQYAEDMLYYIFEKAESKSKKMILSLFQEIAPPEKRDKIMTIAEELRAEGRAEALKTIDQIASQKLQEGKLEGKLEGEKNKAIAKITDLSVDELKNLLH
jgi:hypothetical protein